MSINLVCPGCIWFDHDADIWACEAFPDGIPEKYVTAEEFHLTPTGDEALEGATYEQDPTFPDSIPRENLEKAS